MCTLTLWTVAKRHLLDPCAVSAGGHFHLAPVLVQLAIRTADRLAVITAVSITRTSFEVFLLRTVEDVIALTALNKACRASVELFIKLEVLNYFDVFFFEHH